MGKRAPSDKLNIAVIGIGGMGNSNLKNVKDTENIVALAMLTGDMQSMFLTKILEQKLTGLEEDV